MPDPHWSRSIDQFDAEVDQFADKAGGYRYDAERTSHRLRSRWLDQRRESGPKGDP